MFLNFGHFSASCSYKLEALIRKNGVYSGTPVYKKNQADILHGGGGGLPYLT